MNQRYHFIPFFRWNIIILLIVNLYFLLQFWSLFFGYEATYISCTTHYKKSCIDDIFCLGNLSCGLAPLDYCLALYWRRKNRSWKRMLHTVYLQVCNGEYNYQFNLYLQIGGKLNEISIPFISFDQLQQWIHVNRNGGYCILCTRFCHDWFIRQGMVGNCKTPAGACAFASRKESQ